MSIRKYDITPSSGFIDRIYEHAGTSTDSMFITECIEAHTRMHNAMKYISSSMADHEWFDPSVLLYILSGMDRETFANTAKAEHQI